MEFSKAYVKSFEEFFIELLPVDTDFTFMNSLIPVYCILNSIQIQILSTRVAANTNASRQDLLPR